MITKNSIFVILIALCSFSTIQAQDIDNDGVTDAVDNCKFTNNPDQVDTDSDGIGDVCDCDPVSSNPLGQHRPAILITASPSTTINSGTLVNFSSVIDAGGSSPIYQWKKNGIDIGTNSPTYSDNLLNNGDTIICELISDVACAAGDSSASNSLIFIVNSVSGIEDYYTDNSIIVYPNPSKKEIFIKSNSSVVKADIIDITGRNTKTLKVENNRINIESLSSGTYMLKLDYVGKSIVKKIIVE
jgi:hypothetical protein